MNIDNTSTDASLVYYESSALDTINLDSTAVIGNLADAMKNSVVILDEIILPIEILTDECPDAPLTRKQDSSD